jgi:putative transposase
LLIQAVNNTPDGNNKWTAVAEALRQSGFERVPKQCRAKFERLEKDNRKAASGFGSAVGAANAVDGGDPEIEFHIPGAGAASGAGADVGAAGCVAGAVASGTAGDVVPMSVVAPTAVGAETVEPMSVVGALAVQVAVAAVGRCAETVVPIVAAPAPAPAVARACLPRTEKAALNVQRAKNLLGNLEFCAKAKLETEDVLSKANIVVFEATQHAWVINSLLQLFAGGSRTTLVTLLQQILEKAGRQLDKRRQMLETAKRRLAQYTDPRHSWVRRCFDTDIPYMGSIRNHAFRTLKHNILTNAAKCKKNGGRPFRIHFKTRKKHQTSFAVSWKCWTLENGFWARLRHPKLCRVARYKPPIELVKMDRKGKKIRALPDKDSPAAAQHDVRLLQTRDGQFFVLLRFEVNCRKDSENQRTLRVCSLDPGVRRVLTVYDVCNGRLVKLGDNAIAVLEKLQRRRDELVLRSRADLETRAPDVFKAQGPKDYRDRYNMKQALARLDLHITNMVNALQCDMAKWLCDNFDLILLPRFGTSEMIRRCGRKIGKQTARNLQMLAFYRFEKRLEAMAERCGRKVVICSEAWTSKTCCSCGHINHRLGSSVLFCCENCAFTADRDMVGAVNVFLRYATKFKLQQQQQQQQQPQQQQHQPQQAQASNRKRVSQNVLELRSGKPPPSQGSRPPVGL